MDAAALATIQATLAAIDAKFAALARLPLPLNGEVADVVREATGEIGRVGNLVNQLARVANSGGTVDAAALATIQATLAAIDAKLAALARLP